MVNKKINKKIGYLVILITVTIFAILYLLLPRCATCEYQFGNPKQKARCTEICILTPTWKILFFNLTGKKLDIKNSPQLLPKPS